MLDLYSVFFPQGMYTTVKSKSLHIFFLLLFRSLNFNIVSEGYLTIKWDHDLLHDEINLSCVRLLSNSKSCAQRVKSQIHSSVLCSAIVEFLKL